MSDYSGMSKEEIARAMREAADDPEAQKRAGQAALELSQSKHVEAIPPEGAK